MRPAEVELLIGDPAKAKQKLSWSPSVTFEELVHLMVNADLAALGISSSNGSNSNLKDSAYIRRSIGTMVG